MGRLDIDRLKLAVNGCVTVNGKGYVGNLTDIKGLTGDIALSGNVINVNAIKNNILGKEAAKDFNVAFGHSRWKCESQNRRWNCRARGPLEFERRGL